jgi:hypothetical protein
MHARHLVPQPRCTFVGEDEATGAIVRCGRWFGHADRHQAKDVVLEQMAEAIAAVVGYEQPARRKHSLEDYIVIRSTMDWYTRLVME